MSGPGVRHQQTSVVGCIRSDRHDFDPTRLQRVAWRAVRGLHLTMEERSAFSKSKLNRQWKKIRTFGQLRRFALELKEWCLSLSEEAKELPAPPTDAQWVYYAASVGFRSSAWRFGHMVRDSQLPEDARRKLEALSGETNAEVEIWLGGEPYVGESEIRAAIEELLIDTCYTVVSIQSPIFGSFYQKMIVAIRLFGRYSGRVVGNLGTAFGATANSAQMSPVERLSAVLEKHEHAVVRVHNLIGVKVTRNGKSHVMISLVPPRLQEILEKDPDFITDSDAIYEELLLPKKARREVAVSQASVPTKNRKAKKVKMSSTDADAQQPPGSELRRFSQTRRQTPRIDRE